MPRRRTLLAAAAAILVVVFIVAPAGIAYASLHPERCLGEATPADYGLGYENFTVSTADGVELKGWLIPGSSEAVFVVMHGYTSCKGDERLVRLAAELASRGYTVAMFDFRGHGESSGTTTIGPREARYDVPAVLDYVLSRYPGARLVLVGYSMGAVAAIVGGASYDYDNLVIVADSPYPTLESVIPRWLKHTMGVPEWYSQLISVWGGIMTGEDLDFGPLALERVDKPLLVIVGDRDPLVTPEEAQAIAEKSPAGRAVVVQGAGHVEAARIMGLENYVDLIESFALGGG